MPRTSHLSAQAVAQLKAFVVAVKDYERVRIADNKIEIVDGFGPDGSNGDRLREVLKCELFGALPSSKDH